MIKCAYQNATEHRRFEPELLSSILIGALRLNHGSLRDHDLILIVRPRSVS
jgi:hypothetical protein